MVTSKTTALRNSLPWPLLSKNMQHMFACCARRALARSSSASMKLAGMRLAASVVESLPCMDRCASTVQAEAWKLFDKQVKASTSTPGNHVQLFTRPAGALLVLWAACAAAEGLSYQKHCAIWPDWVACACTPHITCRRLAYLPPGDSLTLACLRRSHAAVALSVLAGQEL